MTENATDGEQAVLSLRTPGDLLAAIPYLVGFRPDDSIVVVGVAEPPTRVVFTMRSDLPETRDPVEVAGRAEYLAYVLAVQEPSCAMIAGFGPGVRVTPIVDAVLAELDGYGIPVREALRAEDGRYWSYLCVSGPCCPAEGTPYDPYASEVAASATLAGCAVLPNRAALAAVVAPVEGAARAAMRRATAGAEERFGALVTSELTADASGRYDRPLVRAGIAAVTAAIDRHRGGGHLSDDEVAWLAALLTHLRVRDEAWVRVDARDDREYRQAMRELWADVLRRVEPAYVPAPAGLLAYAAWRDGDGGLANVALERARLADPTYTMTGLLEKLIGTGTPPSAWRPLTPTDLRDDDARDARARGRRQRRARASSALPRGPYAGGYAGAHLFDAWRARGARRQGRPR